MNNVTVEDLVTKIKINTFEFITGGRI